MKNQFIQLSVILLLACLLNACTKSGNPGPNNNQTGNSSNGGHANTTITYVNASFTTVSITVNNQAQTIAPGGNVQYSGTPGTSATGTATTSGQTAQGGTIGNVISWAVNNNFPASGNLNSTLNVGANFFFLKIQNMSSTSIIRLYVNYQLVDQTLDNIAINNDGQVYNIGYYKAFSNSNARAESSNSYWYWSSVPLPNTQNQSVTLSAN